MSLLQRIVLALVAACVMAVPASAEWVEATSRHFVVYSDESPEKVREFTEKLERFDRAVRTARSA